MPSNTENSWDRVVGQHRVKEILQQALKQRRLAHAYLFWGPEGVGKDALALEFARTILCERQTAFACGECSHCKKMDSLQHPNLKLIFPLPGGDTKKANGEDGESVDRDVQEEIRRQISEKAVNPYFHIAIPKAIAIRIKSIREVKRESSMTAVEQGKKIFVILNAELMNEESANSILKVLEEPLDDTVFLLTTPRKDQLRQTILSRCQLVQCPLLREDEIAQSLIGRYHVPQEEAHLYARLSNGSFGRAVELLSSEIFEERSEAVRFLRSILSGSASKIFEELENYSSAMRRQDAEHVLLLLLMWFRDAMVLSAQGAGSVINRDQQKDLESFLSKFGRADLPACIVIVERTLELLKRNVYLPLVMLSLTIQLKRTIVDGKTI